MLRVSVQSFAGANGLDDAVPRSSGADSHSHRRTAANPAAAADGGAAVLVGDDPDLQCPGRLPARNAAERVVPGPRRRRDADRGAGQLLDRGRCGSAGPGDRRRPHRLPSPDAQPRHRGQLQRLHRAGARPLGPHPPWRRHGAAGVLPPRPVGHRGPSRGRGGALPDHLHGRGRPVDGAGGPRKPPARHARRRLRLAPAARPAHPVRRHGRGPVDLRGTRRLPAVAAALPGLGHVEAHRAARQAHPLRARAAGVLPAA